MTRHIQSIALSWLAVVLLTGCTLFQPQTTEEALGAAYVSIEAVADTAAMRVSTGAVTPEQAQRIRERLVQAKAGVDLAVEALAAGDEGAADKSLATAIAILTALETELQE